MNKYQITNTISGVDLGIYEGNDCAEALDAMAQDAGYTDYDALNEEIPAKNGEIVVTEIDD